METLFDLYTAADELLYIEGKLKALNERKKELHAEFKSRGENIDIAGHGCTIQVRTHTRKNVDIAALKAKVSRQFLQAHTTEKPVTTICVRPESALATHYLKGVA